jgi:hypothetical protein
MSAFSESDAHKAADAVTTNWSVDTAKVEFPPTFSGLPKEFQGSVKNDQKGKANNVFHSDSNTISVVYNEHVEQTAVDALYHHAI